MVKSHCEWCGVEVKRGGTRPGRFCSFACKGAWQRTQKPVDEAWLRQKYVDEGLSTYQIAAIVGRNPKQVYNWLLGYDIKTRERQWDMESVVSRVARQSASVQPFHSEEWLRCEYGEKRRSAREIADQFGVTAANILHWLRRFGIPRRTTREIRATKHWGMTGAANGMYGRRGADHPNWQGGRTPERQAFYSSQEWKQALIEVTRRDGNVCCRCGVKSYGRKGRKSYHIHHIVSFSVPELRTELSNLVTLCGVCHRWVHSRQNVDREFLGKGGGGNGRRNPVRGRDSNAQDAQA